MNKKKKFGAGWGWGKFSSSTKNPRVHQTDPIHSISGGDLIDGFTDNNIHITNVKKMPFFDVLTFPKCYNQNQRMSPILNVSNEHTESRH